MTMQQAITGTPKQFRLPLWKRMTLVTALLLSGGPITVLVSTQAAYASPTSPPQQTQGKPKVIYLTDIVITCTPGKGGKGGKSTGKSSGAAGGNGGSCTVNIPIEVTLTENNIVLSAKTVANANNVTNAKVVKHANTVSRPNTTPSTNNAPSTSNASSANTVPGTNMLPGANMLPGTNIVVKP